MAIIVYTGKPGAGKTYRVVKELLEDSGRYYVFHNIDGLKESMIEGGRYIQSWVGIDNFFTKKKQTEICEWARKEYNRSVLVIVDECQMVLGDRRMEIKEWLSWHRHLGQDVKLICQHFKMINSDYYNLCDYEIRGKRGYITSQLVYQWGVNGETFKTDRLKLSKAVFAAYTSFVGEEVNKGRSKMLYVGVGAFVLAICMGVYVIGFGLPGTFAAGSGKKSPAKHNGKQVASEKVVTASKAKNTDATLARLRKLSYAGVMGADVLMQDVDTLEMVHLGEVMEYRLVEARGNYALVNAKDRGLVRLNVRGGRYLVAGKIKVDAARAPVAPD